MEKSYVNGAILFKLEGIQNNCYPIEIYRSVIKYRKNNPEKVINSKLCYINFCLFFISE